jgi:glycosyltransferase involved in cell wall biosynthesis
VEEIVVDGVNGWICRDVADMAAHITSTEVVPESCRDDAEKRFSVARMAEEYAAIYEEAARGVSAAPKATVAPAAELEA